MSRLLRRTLVGLLAGVVVYAGAMVYFGFAPIADALEGFPWWVFVVALLLSSLNYVLRFLKWELALGWLNVRADAPGLTRGRSFVIYLAGLSMSITPGKLGEVLRSLLLRSSDGVSFARTAPVVLADRLTDLVALVVLSLVGVSLYPQLWPIVGATAALVVGGVVVLGSPRLLHGLLGRLSGIPGLSRVATAATPLVESTAVLLRVRGLVVLSAVSVVGWGLECVGYWLIVDAFGGTQATLLVCTFLWAAGTLVGALSFLPGGLFATEGSLVVATMTLVAGATQPIALAAAFLGRVATLWYGELVGGVALAIFLRDPAVRARALADDAEPHPPLAAD